MSETPVVLITGASSGIGDAIAREYARRGRRLALLARRVDRLNTLARELGNGSRAFECDVTKDGDIERAIDATLDAFGRIDVVIANAGFGVEGWVDRLTLEDFRRQFETNVFGVIRTAKAAIEPLRKTRGRLAITGSVAGYIAAPGVGAYNMSKAAVRSFAETLSFELAVDGISVTHIAPGFVRSEIRLLDGKGTMRDDARDPIPSWLVMPSDVAARQMVAAIEARKPEVVVTGHGKAITFLSRHAPQLVGGIVRTLAPRVLKPKRAR